MAQIEPTVLRTYGNWRKPRSGGLGTLSAFTTVVFFAGALVVLITMLIGGVLPAVIAGVILAVVLYLLNTQDKHGRSIVARINTRLGFMRASRARTNVYRSGPLGFTPWGTNQLPGMAAASELSEHTDSWARPFGLIHLPAHNNFTVVFQGEPDGASLVDQSQVDLWVAHWGQWLNALGNEPGAIAASVTIETAPDFGTRLRREVASMEDVNAPALAKHVMQQIVEDYPRGSATVRALIAVTFKGQNREGVHRRSTAEVAGELASRVGFIGQQLGATGAGAVRPLSAAELCEFVRVAYDPSSAAEISAARADGEPVELDWSQVGPVGADSGWDFYRHDSGYSKTWQMSQAPRGEVYSNVLQRLLEPSASVDRKRITLLYRPIEPGRAAQLVEDDVKHARIRATSTNQTSQRVLAEESQAMATAREEAKGAGLVNFGMVVTATVLDRDRMADASSAIENLAAGARLFLRPMYGSQDAGFAASLPLGLILPEYQLVPSAVMGGR